MTHPFNAATAQVAVSTTTNGAFVRWQPWSTVTFAHARAANRLIFVDVGIEGCAACQRMGEMTLTDPAVIERLRRRFVSIRVDAEARPDLGERYSDWAWPALIFMAPDGSQLLAIRGSRPPGNFLELLDELIARQDAGTLTADGQVPLYGNDLSNEAAVTNMDSLRLRARSQMDGMLDEALGSWRQGGLGARSWRLYEHLRFRAHLYQDNRLAALANTSAATHLKLLDPVWGGSYQAWAADGGGSAAGNGRVVPGKRISAQAGALRVFADAYQLTGEQRYLRALERVDGYLQEWLRSERGTYYASQRAAPPALPARISVADYWQLSTAHERRQFGIPPIDHAIYTDKNAQIISAYVRAFEATGDPNYLGAARTAAAALLDERLHAAGWIRQDGASRRLVDDLRQYPGDAPEVPFLAAQVWMATALLDLYQADLRPRWIEAASAIADAMLANLYDGEVGGFYGAPAVAGEGPAAWRHKPLEANALAARLYYRLGVLDGNPSALPVEILGAVALPQLLAREGKSVAETGLALEWLHASYVEFSVVSKPDAADGQALYRAALGAYQPRKILHFEAPGRYPDRDRAALYICNPDRCTAPIEDPADISRALTSFHRAAENPYP